MHYRNRASLISEATKSWASSHLHFNTHNTYLAFFFCPAVYTLKKYTSMIKIMIWQRGTFFGFGLSLKKSILWCGVEVNKHDCRCEQVAAPSSSVRCVVQSYQYFFSDFFNGLSHVQRKFWCKRKKRRQCGEVMMMITLRRLEC